MTSDDDLRAKLRHEIIKAKVLAEEAGQPSTLDIFNATWAVVREALASAWDHGHRTANPVIPDTHRDVINPWKQP